MIIVVWGTIFLEESFLPVPITGHHLSVDLLVIYVFDVMLKAIQHISGMKIVNPMKV